MHCIVSRFYMMMVISYKFNATLAYGYDSIYGTYTMH